MSAGPSRPQLLAEASRAFTEAAADMAALHAVIVRRVAELVGDACSLRLLTEDGVLVRTAAAYHMDPNAQAILSRPGAADVISLDQGASGEVLRTGRPLLLPVLSPTALPPLFNPRLSSHSHLFPLYSFLAVPIRIADRLAGVLVATRHRPNLPYLPEDQQLLEELAERAGLALHNARLAVEQQEARAEAARAADLAARLHDMLSGFVNAKAPQQVADVIVSQGFDALKASSGAVAMLDEDGETLHYLAARGYPREFLEHYPTVPLDSDSPMSVAARAGEPLWIESRPEYLTRFPSFAPKVIYALGAHGLACLPLSVEGRLVGALAFGFDRPHTFTAHERAFALTLARQCAQALERVQLLEQERQLKEAARFVALASSRLSESLDLRTTLATLSSLIVPELAEVLAAHLMSPDGRLSLEHVACAEPAEQPRVEALLRGEGGALLPSGAELERGAARLWGRRAGPGGGAGRLEDEARRALESLSAVSWLTVPLRSRGRTLGVLSLGRRAAPFATRQVELAEELGRRAALAVDNATLYELELHSRERAERALARTVGLQKLTAAISRALVPEDVVAVMMKQGLAILEASAGAMWRLSPDGRSLELLQMEQGSDVAQQRFRRVPVEIQLPVGDAVRGRAPVWVESWAELSEHYPLLAEALGPPMAGFSMVALPLEAEDRVFGGIGFRFDKDRRFHDEDRGFVEVLAGLCAQGLERARLYEAERRSRERMALLASASEVLAASLDYETTLNTVAGLALHALADFVWLDVRDGDGELRRIARALDPAKQEVLAASQPSIESTAPCCTLVTGKSFFHAEVDEAWLAKELRDCPREQELLHRMGACSIISVPLPSNSGLLGALTLGFAESGRHHGPADVQLTEELARRAAAALENARLFRQAQQAIRLRDEFLSIAGHELNTPLTSLKIQVDSLRARAPEPAQVQRKLEKASQQISRLAKLVSALLDVSRITDGRLKLELAPVDLATTVREVAGRLADELSRSGSELRLKITDCVVGRWDSLRMDQVVTNLLSNAIKYGQGREIEVSVQGDAEKATLVVKDEGIGISPEAQPRLFQRFERAVSARHYGGFGLGLWIVKQVVEAHGGNIHVQSRPGVGSTFVVELPREPAIRAH